MLINSLNSSNYNRGHDCLIEVDSLYEYTYKGLTVELTASENDTHTVPDTFGAILC